MTAALTSRTRWFKRPWFLIIAVAIFPGLVAFAVSDAVRFAACSAAQLCIYGMPQPSDVQETDELRNIIAATYHFAQNSVSQPDRPPVFGNDGSKMLLTQPTEIEVYGVRARAEQDRVISAVQNTVRDKKFKPVDLHFMDHENWILHGNGGERGPELQLRRVRISRTGVQEEGGKKKITYPVP